MVAMTDLAELTAATAHLDPPLVALDAVALRANAADLVRRAGGKPVRVASKSVRCRSVLDLALATPGFAGVMGYSLREAIWLVRHGVRDVLLGYPSADRGALAELAADPVLVGGDHADGRRCRAVGAGPSRRRRRRPAGLPRRRRLAADRTRAPGRAAVPVADAG